MKHPHLLRVVEEPGAFGPLVAAARAEGIRIGWLDLREGPVPPVLEQAARLGVLRAVASTAGRTVAVKPIRGPAVLRDLLREHFLGCRLVLVAGGPPEIPLLEVDDLGWRLTGTQGGERHLATDQLITRLRRSRAFGSEKGRGRDPGARG